MEAGSEAGGTFGGNKCKCSGYIVDGISTTDHLAVVGDRITIASSVVHVPY